MKKNSMWSLAGKLNGLSRTVMLLVFIPCVWSLFVMGFYAAGFNRSVSAMSDIAALRPIVTEDIPEKVWAVVAGRNSFADSGVYEQIDEVNEVLDRFLAEWADSSTELLVARRTMNTLESYVRQVEEQVADEHVPVVRSEKTLEEVRAVASLIGDMLERFVDAEVLEVAKRNSSLVRTATITMVLAALILAGSFLLAGMRGKKVIRLIRGELKRLELFTNEMADGNLQARVSPTELLELKNLTEDVNIMATRMEDLIEQNRKEQEKLQKAELRTLQAQINPHFLYNTLDTVVWEAEAGKNDEVVSIIKSLSDFYRSSLSEGRDWVSVEEELRHLNGYLSIQKIRYRDILNYEVEIGEEMYGYTILKLLLQPLVENAIYHGIRPRRGGGMIRVSGRIEGERLHFRVQDTGVGMSPERLSGVLDTMRDEKRAERGPNEPEKGGGFGLYNVDQRIRLYYGEDRGLEIGSGPDGTTVSFSVPIRELKTG